MQHMDTYTANSNAYRAAREAAQDRAHAGLPVLVAAPVKTTDALNAQAIDQMLADIALTKRATARLYTRKRWALRELVRFGVFTPEEARRMSPPLVNLLSKWRALKNMRRELTSC